MENETREAVLKGLIYGTISLVFLNIKGCMDDKYYEKNYLKKESLCTAIIINNGTVTRLDNVSKVGRLNKNYEVSFYDEKSLVVYVYDDLENDGYNQKEVFANYIISCILIGEDNTVYFDKTAITKEGFIEYKNQILNNNEESVRVRK